MPFNPAVLVPSSPAARHSENDAVNLLDADGWLPVVQHACDFDPQVFEQVSINLLRNPNINSSHLFRADILYDSFNNEHTNVDWPKEDLEDILREFDGLEEAFKTYQIKRTWVRRMIPRNPQLDRPIAQTCHFLQSIDPGGVNVSLVLYIPHVSHVDAMPWYHPAVRSLAYMHTWKPPPVTMDAKDDPNATNPSIEPRGSISIYYLIFPSQTLPLSDRLMRTAHHLLSTLHKHGQGALAGYIKRVQHDRLVSQQRVQNRYVELKAKYAKRLCENWVEQTEPSKHVFEDLGIAAFLIELWKDMYDPASAEHIYEDEKNDDNRISFPGFVDIGCGNGLLTEILLQEGYKGWGFDARRRKTWSILSETTQKNLHELLLIPQPFFSLPDPPPIPSTKYLSRVMSTIFHPTSPTIPGWHNGIFPLETFIISNHADELTPWTPLLASLSRSPFLAIPCCSHNFSGQRFRAPSVFNSLTADRHAPAYFANNVKQSKSVPITIATNIDFEDDDESTPSSSPSTGNKETPSVQNPSPQRSSATSTPHPAAETGDLKTLAPSARAKQPSAYSSLCDWIAHLTTEVGYVAEKEVLRIPSTRNIAIVGRTWVDGTTAGDGGDEGQRVRTEKVERILRREGADGKVWVERGRGLRKEKDQGKGKGKGKGEGAGGGGCGCH